MRVNASDIAEVLGGSDVLGRVVRGLGDLNAVVAAGLPFAVIDSLERHITADGRRVSRASVRGVVRARRSGGNAIMAAAAGERAERVARIYATAERTFGSPQGARQFLVSPHVRLDGRTPLECLGTDIGGREVEEILEAIAYGLPA